MGIFLFTIIKMEIFSMSNILNVFLFYLIKYLFTNQLTCELIVGYPSQDVNRNCIKIIMCLVMLPTILKTRSEKNSYINLYS
jgi:hypothetical protein